MPASECGTRAYGHGRIEGGEEVVPHSIPWQVKLFPGCGGTLISPRHVLSAAHCFCKIGQNIEWCQSQCSRWSVGLGMHNIMDRDGLIVKVQHISIPEDFVFTENDIENDFALLTLASEVKLNDKIRIACLPNINMSHDFLVGKDLTVSGWGRGSDGVNCVECMLHRAQYPGITNEYCQELYNTDPEGVCEKAAEFHPQISESHLCAGIPFPSEKSHSSGDSGGMLCRSFISKYLSN